MTWLAAIAACMWLGLLILPWRPWSTRERLELEPRPDDPDLGSVSVLIPARDEASCIGETLARLARQGRFSRIVVIDDQSSDGTGDVARAAGIDQLTVLSGSTPEPGWSGKLWALHQGLQQCESPYVLLLDADIGLEPGVVTTLLARLERERLDMISIMANLHMRNFWERLLLPPFVYFFKLIYPFALANDARSFVAAGAGGCVLLRRTALDAIGGFGSLREAIIDDCTLAKRIKQLPGRIWIGLSNDARALRPYGTLANIWNMVARTAYTQLRYSPLWLLVCTVLLVLAYIVPITAVFSGVPAALALAVIALAAMFASYAPTIRYYGLGVAWIASLPLAAVMFLAMTWTSAVRYTRGERSRWKNRSYATAEAGDSNTTHNCNELNRAPKLDREPADDTGLM